EGGGRPEETGRHENARRDRIELQRPVERGLHRRGRGGGGHTAHIHTSDADARRDRRLGRGRVRSRARDRSGESQCGEKNREKAEALHVVRVEKILGSSVMIPSASAAISRRATVKSLTVHT